MGLRCVCCDAIMTAFEQDENEYCTECQRYVRQVFDKDEEELNKLGGYKTVSLEWTVEDF